MLVERQVVATFLAAGAKNLDLPSIDEARAEFHDQLLAEPVAVPRELVLKRRALGV